MRKYAGSVAFVLAVLCGGQVEALDIVWNGIGTSGFDTTERGVVNAAMAYWEHLIVDNGSTYNRVFLQIKEVPDSSTTYLGVTVDAAEDINYAPIYGSIEINSYYESLFFDDPTPTDNSEYSSSGDPQWMYAFSAPAYNKQDLFSVMLHEIGHVMGFSDGYHNWHYFDFSSTSLILEDGDPAHVSPDVYPHYLMTPAATRGERRFISDLELSTLGRAFGYVLTPDIDRDYDVDTADLTTILQNFTGDMGVAGNKTHAYGDLDSDGDVDTFDITFALQNFTGASQSGLGGSAGLAATTVPEPSSWLLLVIGALGLLRMRRKRQG